MGRDKSRSRDRDRDRDKKEKDKKEKEKERAKEKDKKAKKSDSDSDSDDDKAKKDKKDPKKDDADAKKSEADKAKRQQEATLAVLACFQKLSDVNLENFESVKAEYAKVMATELPDTGAQQEVLKAQAEQAFGYAETYITKLKGGSEEELRR